MRWYSGVVALVIAVPAAAQQAQQTPSPQGMEVTLTEAIQRALQVQPSVAVARGDQRNTGAAKRSAYGAFLPFVTVGASAARSNVGRIDQTTGRPIPPEYTYTGSLNASLELFDGFARFANLKATSALNDAADAGVVNERFLTTFQTKQLFYAAVATEALVRVADAQVKRTQQQLQISVEKLRAGSATRSDSLRSTVEFGNARIGLLRANGNLLGAQANLGRQIGVDGPVRAAFDSMLPPMPDTADLRQTAISSSPAVDQAESRASAARALVWSARSEYWPSLVVSYNNSRQGSENPNWPFFSNYPETFQWRFGLSWPLLNGFNREANQISASVTRDVAVARAADTRRQVSALVTQQLATLGAAFEQIRISDDNLAAAREDLRVQSERYRVGAATILDLLTSQAALTSAEVTVIQTRFDYLLARARLEATVGRTL